MEGNEDSEDGLDDDDDDEEFIPNVGLVRQVTLTIVGFHLPYRLTATLNLCSIYFKIT